MLLFYALLSVWEGPLYVEARAEAPIRFRVQGPAGFHAFEVFGPDRRLAEWTSDDIGLLWDFTCKDPRRFPPMKLDFSYGNVPTGFQQKTFQAGAVAAPLLDPNVTYLLRVQPAMGMPETYSLRGSQIAEFEVDPTMCWGSLPVDGQLPAIVRVDCTTRKALPMSARGVDRLKAYQERRLPFF